MRLKWFPRSWVQIITDNYVIYFDPSYIATYYKRNLKKIVFSDREDDVLPEELRIADIILISHIHKDHCKEVTKNRISYNNTLIYTPENYSKSDDKRIKIVKPNSLIEIENVKVNILPSYNTPNGNSTRKVHKLGQCNGYILSIEGKKIYFTGDTDFIPEMNDIKDVDIALLPIGGIYTMDIKEAIKAAVTIEPKLVIPIHHLSSDPLLFKNELEKYNIKTRVLNIGEEIEI